jgi:hypothetical protein
MNNSDAECSVYVPQWQEKLGWRLFPAHHIDSPELPCAHDVLVCVSRVHLSWIDRLRVLISGKIEVTSKTTTKGVIGDHISASVFSARPPAWLDRRD